MVAQKKLEKAQVKNSFMKFKQNRGFSATQKQKARALKTQWHAACMPATSSRSSGTGASPVNCPKNRSQSADSTAKNGQIIRNADHDHPHDDPMILKSNRPHVDQRKIARMAIFARKIARMAMLAFPNVGQKSHDSTFLPSGTSILASFVFSRAQFSSRFFSFESSHVLRKMFAKKIGLQRKCEK